MKKIFENYKTSLPAILILGALGLYWSNYITREQMEAGVGLLMSAGLLGAKDYTKKDRF